MIEDGPVLGDERTNAISRILQLPTYSFQFTIDYLW